MEKVLKYKEFLESKKIAESSNEDSVHSPLNEGFLDAIVRFFKGMLDLFNNKKLKSESEESMKDWNRITDDDEIEDEEIADEIDTKRVRRRAETSSKTIKTQVATDTEKGIRTTADLNSKFASWLAQIIIYQNEVLKMPVIQKMLKNSEMSKRFVWVPKDFRSDEGAKKEWYSNKSCVLDKEVAKSLMNLPDAKKPDDVKLFAKKYIEQVAKYRENGLKKLKDNQPDFLDDMYDGISSMINSVISGMDSIVKNTSDDKMSEVIAEEIVKDREAKRKSGKKSSPKKKYKEDESDEAGESRSRRGKKSEEKEKSSKEKSTEKDSEKKSYPIGSTVDLT